MAALGGDFLAALGGDLRVLPLLLAAAFFAACLRGEDRVPVGAMVVWMWLHPGVFDGLFTLVAQHATLPHAVFMAC